MSDPMRVAVNTLGGPADVHRGIAEASDMAACALEFESGEIGVHRLLASQRSIGAAALPLPRQHLCANHPSN